MTRARRENAVLVHSCANLNGYFVRNGDKRDLRAVRGKGSFRAGKRLLEPPAPVVWGRRTYRQILIVARYRESPCSLLYPQLSHVSACYPPGKGPDLGLMRLQCNQSRFFDWSSNICHRAH